jgi:hypothetical protein
MSGGGGVVHFGGVALCGFGALFALVARSSGRCARLRLALVCLLARHAHARPR